MVWLAPLPRSSAGRSALIARSGICATSASTIAGKRLATAVPDVVITTPGRPVARATPSAQKASPRSSVWTVLRARGWRATASASGVLRAPGPIANHVHPSRTSSSTRRAARVTLRSAVVTRPPDRAGRRARGRWRARATRIQGATFDRISCHSSSGSDPATMPAPAYAWRPTLDHTAERMPTAISALSWDTTPTGPAYQPRSNASCSRERASADSRGTPPTAGVGWSAARRSPSRTPRFSTAVIRWTRWHTGPAGPTSTSPTSIDVARGRSAASIPARTNACSRRSLSDASSSSAAARSTDSTPVRGRVPATASVISRSRSRRNRRSGLALRNSQPSDDWNAKASARPVRALSNGKRRHGSPGGRVQRRASTTFSSSRRSIASSALAIDARQSGSDGTDVPSSAPCTTFACEASDDSEPNRRSRVVAPRVSSTRAGQTQRPGTNACHSGPRGRGSVGLNAQPPNAKAPGPRSARNGDGFDCRRLGHHPEAREARAVAVLPVEPPQAGRGVEPCERIDGALEADERGLVLVREATERLRDRAHAPAVVHGADPS